MKSKNSVTRLLLLSSLLGSTGALVNASVRADTTVADDLLGNLYTMKSVYRAEYAPAAWKKKFAAYDLDVEFAKAAAAIQANPNMSMKESRKILKDFIYSMKDYHTSISFVSTESASLPFTVKSTGNKVFIVYIDRNKLSEATFPFHEGDELVSFDDKLASQALSEVQAEIPENVPATDKAIAETRLTRRAAARGYNVPKGTITIGVKTKGTATEKHFQLIWEYNAEQIGSRLKLASSTVTKIANGSEQTPPSAFHPLMNVDFANTQITSPYDIGSKKTFTPILGTPIWQSAENDVFHAYMYKTADRKLIGYIRIASYVVPDYVKALAEFSTVVALFQATTDAMVIDQVNNPGGSVFYLYGLASMLTEEPLKTPRHKMAINQGDVADAIAQIEKLKDVRSDEDAKKVLSPGDLDGYPASFEFAQFFLNASRFIVNEWNSGRKLSQPYWIAGVDHINPAPVHYTKPILLLINHLDFSGGDFFPAIMQDNHRVTIMGSRTAGAGGYVNDIKVQNNIGIDSFRCTESIAERIDGNPIENLGVKPELEYEFSEADYTQNFAPYVQAIQATLNTMIK